MNELTLVPIAIEVTIASLGLISLLAKNFHQDKIIKFLLKTSLILFLLFFGFLVNGNIFVAFTATKIILFILIFLYASQNHRNALYYLFLTILVFLFSQATEGHIFDKVSAIPFVILACIWISLKQRITFFEYFVLFLAIALELTQSLILSSRGLFLVSTASIFILCIPKGIVVKSAIFFARFIPIVYPVLISLVFVAILVESDAIAPTSSNYERSAMAAWSIINFPNYLFSGPGIEIFTEEMNAIKTFGQQAEADNYDAHQFLLSFWTYLGTISTVTLYYIWFKFWEISHLKQSYFWNYKIRIYCILIIHSTSIFTLYPPDSFSRMQCALLAGIAISGLSNLVSQNNRVRANR